MIILFFNRQIHMNNGGQTKKNTTTTNGQGAQHTHPSSRLTRVRVDHMAEHVRDTNIPIRFTYWASVAVSGLSTIDTPHKRPTRGGTRMSGAIGAKLYDINRAVQVM